MAAKTRKVPRFLTSEVPLYYQLGTLLREQILSGHYAPGEQLPTETELVADYGVSRITVRQALKTLEEQNLVRREAGRGTFVTDELPLPRTLRMNGSLDDLISMGIATSVKLLDLREVVATREDAEAFAVPEGSPVVQCRRLRHHQKLPYSYIINRLPKSIADQFEDDDWETGAILQTIEQRLGLHVRDAEHEVRATVADVSLAKVLHTRIGAPILSVDRMLRTDSGEVVERVHTFYRGEIYSLTVRLTRDPARSRPAREWTLKDAEDK